MNLISASVFCSPQFYRYWIEQVDAINDFEGTKPIIVVGTHADKLSKKERETLTKEMELQYPVPTQKANRSQIQGHFAVSLEKGGSGQYELKCKLLDLALSHEKIGVGNVQVPKSFSCLQDKLQIRKQKSPYIHWKKYEELAEKIGNYQRFTVAY